MRVINLGCLRQSSRTVLCAVCVGRNAPQRWTLESVLQFIVAVTRIVMACVQLRGRVKVAVALPLRTSRPWRCVDGPAVEACAVTEAEAHVPASGLLP